MRSIFIITIMFLLTACAAQVTVTSAKRATSTLPPPAATAIPTPTLHPQFLALQTQIAASGADFTLLSDGTIEEMTADGATTIPGLSVAKNGQINLLVNGEQVTLDSADVSFDDKNGAKINGYEFDEETGEWVAEAIEPAPEIIQYPVVEKAEDFRSCFIPAEALFDGKDGEVSSVVRYLKSISTEMTYDLSKLKFVDLQRSVWDGGTLFYTTATNPDYLDPETRPYDRKYFCYTTDATGMDHFVSFVQYYVEGEKPENFPWVVITSPIPVPDREQIKVDFYTNRMSFPVIATTKDSVNSKVVGDNPLTSITFERYSTVNENGITDIQDRFNRFANGDPTALDGLVLETLTVSSDDRQGGFYR